MSPFPAFLFVFFFTIHKTYATGNFSSLSFDIAQDSLLKFPNSTNVTQTTKEVFSKLNCIEDCADTPWCLSINFKITAQKNGLHLCEFLSADMYNNQQHLVKDDNYIHYSVKNPCKSNPCTNGGSCTFHSNKKDFRCDCTSNYRGNRCQEDINECTGSSPVCHDNAKCINTHGSFKCSCNHGYEGDGKTNCSDINECTRKTHQCDTDGDCVNTVGSYKCNCKPSLYFNGTKCVRYQFRGLGNSSIITNYGNESYFNALSGYLNPVLKYSDSYWVKCWHGLKDDFLSATFHRECDGKGPTVLIVNVKKLFIFGGYTDVSWHTTTLYSSSNVSFVYSLYNINGFQPVKLNIIDRTNAIYGNIHWGPTFGKGNDLYISNKANVLNSVAGSKSYETPPGCANVVGCKFMADTNSFLVQDVEMFYEVDGSTM